MTWNIILITVVSAVITFLFVPLAIKLANKYKLTDNPKTRQHPAHTHTGIIPRAGGLPIFLGIFLPSFIFLKFNQQIWGVLLGATLLILVGLWDDRENRSPYIRLLTNSLAVAIIVLTGITIPYITNPFGGILKLYEYQIVININGMSYPVSLISGLFAFIWISWTMNIVGWSGGIDGQLPGFVSISAFIIGLLSLRFATSDNNQLTVTYLSFLTAGAFLGFLPWNFYPQKIMPGYGGKTLAGFMLAVLSIMSFSKLGTALLVLAVPMTDAAFMLIRRILSGKSPVWATSGHLHHHLLSLGWSKKAIAFFYWTISLATGMIALMLNSTQKIFAGILIIVLMMGLILWINYLRRIPKDN